jgi:hypothetical protein
MPSIVRWQLLFGVRERNAELGATGSGVVSGGGVGGDDWAPPQQAVTSTSTNARTI